MEGLECWQDTVPNREHIAWIDCETTGLDFDNDSILEIAVIITDKYLKEIEHYEAIVRQPEVVLDTMSEWARKTHSLTPSLGISLADACRSEGHSLPLAEIETHLCSLLDKYRGKRKLQIAGSSVWVDKVFIMKRMPALHERLHYRVVDVSTLLECVKRWSPGIIKYQPENTVDHRAISDIRSSLQLMRYYKSELFNPVEDNRSRANSQYRTQPAAFDGRAQKRTVRVVPPAKRPKQYNTDKTRSVTQELTINVEV